MKRFYLLLLFIGVVSFSFAQQIPFQGRLLEAGIPVDGDRNFVFSIDVDGNIWTETHSSVPVSEGLYSIVLGSIAPLPNDLFSTSDSRSLEISVNGSPMSPVEIFGSVARVQDSYSETIDAGSDFDQGLLWEIDGDGKDINNAIRGNASTNSLNTGVGGYSTSGAGNTANQYGLFGEAKGDGTGAHNGVYGVAESTGKYNRGLRGYAAGAGNGDTGPGFGEGSINFGVEGNATGNAWNNTGVEGSNFGSEGVWNFGLHGISNAGTGAAVENHGIAGRAYGPGINYGVYGQASGGPDNRAGHFEAADGAAPNNVGVWIETTAGSNAGNSIYSVLDVDGSNSVQSSGIFNIVLGNSPVGGEFRGVQSQVYTTGGGMNTGVRAYAGGDGINRGIWSTAELGTENWAGWFEGDVMVTGNLVTSSGNPLQFNNGGGNLRAEMALESDGGVFNAYGSTNQIVAAIGASIGNDAQGFMGVMNSTGGVNGFMKVQDDGAGGEKGRLLVYNNVDGKSVALDGGRGDLNIYGSNKKNAFLGTKWWDNPDHGMMVLYGSVEVDDGGGPYLPDLVALETIDAGGGNEMGKLILRNTDGSTFEIDANGMGPVSALSNSAMDINVKNPGWDPGNAGFMHIRADTPASTDGTRAAIESYNDGSGNSWGSLGLLASVFNDPGCAECPRNFITMEPRRDEGGSDPSGWTGAADFYGTNSPNIQLGARGYQNHDLGSIKLYGNRPDGGGWFFPHVELEVVEDGSQQYAALSLLANDGDLNINLGAKPWEDPIVGSQRPYLEMQGSLNDNSLVWMEVYDVDGDGLKEAGAITFNSTDGSEFSINAYGFSGVSSAFRAKEVIAVAQTSDVNLNSIEMFDSGDAGYMNINNSLNLNSISFDGENGSVSFAKGMVGAGPDGDDSPGDGEFSIGSSSASAIRMYGKLDDVGGSRSHIALDGESGEYLYLWGDGAINVGNGGAESSINMDNIGVSMDNGGGMAQYATLSASPGGPGGAVFGGLFLSDDLGNSVSVNGHGDINISDPEGTFTIWDPGDGVLLERTPSGGHIVVAGTGFIDIDAGSGNVDISGSYLNTSDKRYKKNINTLDNALENTLRLRGVSYNWKDENKSQRNQIGIIAQEVEEVYPEFVHTNDEGMKAVNYAQMVAVLIEAVKELNSKIETLESENAELQASLTQARQNETEIQALKKQVESLVAMFDKVGSNDFQVTGEEK